MCIFKSVNNTFLQNKMINVEICGWDMQEGILIM